MKTKVILFLAVVLTATAAFVGYRSWDEDRTDAVSPEFTVAEEMLELSVHDPESALLQGITAWDNRDGDVTGSILVESAYGITDGNCVTVTYAAFDAAGNVAKVQRSVRYTDYIAPRFTLSKSLAFVQDANEDVLNRVGATDLIDGDITRRVRATLISDTTSVSYVGTHEVQFQVTNSIGHTVQTVLPVEVYSPDKYNASLELDEYILYLSAGDRFEAKEHLSALSIFGRKVDLSGGLPSDTLCSVSGSVDTGTPGVYPVRYTVTRTENGNTYVGYSMLIVIVE